MHDKQKNAQKSIGVGSTKWELELLTILRDFHNVVTFFGILE